MRTALEDGVIWKIEVGLKRLSVSAKFVALQPDTLTLAQAVYEEGIMCDRNYIVKMGF